MKRNEIGGQHVRLISLRVTAPSRRPRGAAQGREAGREASGAAAAAAAATPTPTQPSTLRSSKSAKGEAMSLWTVKTEVAVSHLTYATEDQENRFMYDATGGQWKGTFFLKRSVRSKGHYASHVSCSYVAVGDI